MRLAWLTDLHLNFVSQAAIEAFAAEVRAAAPEAILLGGDISEAPEVEFDLALLARRIARPLYFVLGNHDFYHGSVAEVRLGITRLAARLSGVCYLSSSGVVPLTARTALVGHDGWGDARYGDFAASPVRLTDFRLIADLAGREGPALAEALGRLGLEAGDHLRSTLPSALDAFEQVVVLTHVPPFPEACWYKGALSGPDHLPHFACQATGDAILEAAASYPHRQILVLCGHTHSAGEARLAPNLTVLTGAAEYGRPAVERLFEVP